MSYHLNSIVNVGLLVATLVITAGVLYLPGGTNEDKAFGVACALALPSAATLANYFLMQEQR